LAWYNHFEQKGGVHLVLYAQTSRKSPTNAEHKVIILINIQINCIFVSSNTGYTLEEKIFDSNIVE
jgi:hypothetical protein